jgi:hypothetical protein
MMNRSGERVESTGLSAINTTDTNLAKAVKALEGAKDALCHVSG